MTKTQFMREAFSDMNDNVHKLCYEAILIGDLHEVARLIGMATTQAVLEHEADLVLGYETGDMRNLEKELDDRDRARDMNEQNKEAT